MEMTRKLPVVLMLLTSGIVFACSPQGDGEAPNKEEEKVYKEGELHFADKRLRVVPFVMRTPEMDLFVACRLAMDARVQAGAEPGELCYDPEKREAFSEVLIQEVSEATVGTLMGILGSRREGAHFLVEKTGTMYQVLDMAYGPRREGQVRREEVRVLSGSAEGTEKLLALLREHFPDFKVKRAPLESAGEGAPETGEGAKP